MVTILIYVLLGMLIYAFIIPVLDQFTTIVIQWLENIKGQLVIKAQTLRNELTDLEEETEPTSKDTITNVIGFQMPEEVDYYEEDYEEDD